MAILRGPIQWYGGKGRLTKDLMKLVPPHEHYVEVFGGGAALLFAKQPCHGTETYNDLDSGLVNLFRILRDPDKCKRFEHLASLTLYSREGFDYCKDTWQDCEDDVERAYRWFVTVKMSIVNRARSWGYAVSAICYCGRAHSYRYTVDRLSDIHDRLKYVQVEHRDFRVLIGRHNTPGTLLYCDPPYVPSTRKSKSVYSHEMTIEDHEDLIDILLQYPQMVMLSGYDSPLYSTLGWHKSVIHTVCHASVKIDGARAGLREECVWLNPLAWSTLNTTRPMSLF